MNVHAMLDDFHLSDAEIAFFHENGYVGPFQLFDEDLGTSFDELILGKRKAFPILESPHRGSSKSKLHKLKGRVSAKIELIRQAMMARWQKIVRTGEGPQGWPRYWYKSTQFLIPEIAKLALMPHFVNRMQSILGQDLQLWGAHIMTKQSISHRWHVDVEHSRWKGATAWLGINNIGPDNTIKVVPGSHLYDFSPQELRDQTGCDLHNDESMLTALRQFYPKTEIVKMELSPGSFIIFAGSAWHASHDVSDKLRSAIILQYCPPSERVLVPCSYDMPNPKFLPGQPWVMPISGKDRFQVNFVQAAPDTKGAAFEGKVVAITGGSRGIGLSVAAKFASLGAKVGLLARDELRLQSAKRLLEFLYDADVSCSAGDLTDPRVVEDGVGKIEAELGMVDILINNAGVFRNLGPFWEFEPKAWIDELPINVVATYLTARRVAKTMVARGGGTIINFVGGGAGSAIPFGSSYSTGKAASARLTECMAEDCNHTGVHIYGLDPGFVRTNMTLGNGASAAGAKWRPQIKTMLDVNLDQSPEYAASLAVALSKGESSQRTGTIGQAGMTQLAHKLRYIRDDGRFSKKSWR